ncbi:hypothetical protein AC579_1106 [Pseudocercospora musae]|uniref:Uncharacterized protein n=1 Tax=Pseudocercospora musae TaxID=113226 RepID=A0A139I017_9PEZI|nr:hypothetical protein AC579_1106 [Pseudocercospora musae]
MPLPDNEHSEQTTARTVKAPAFALSSTVCSSIPAGIDPWRFVTRLGRPRVSIAVAVNLSQRTKDNGSSGPGHDAEAALPTATPARLLGTGTSLVTPTARTDDAALVMGSKAPNAKSRPRRRPLKNLFSADDFDPLSSEHYARIMSAHPATPSWTNFLQEQKLPDDDEDWLSYLASSRPQTANIKAISSISDCIVATSGFKVSWIEVTIPEPYLESSIHTPPPTLFRVPHNWSSQLRGEEKDKADNAIWRRKARWHISSWLE